LPVNRQPVNQEALKWLRAAREPADPLLPYLAQLVNLGFQQNLPVPGLGDRYWADLELAAGQLLDPKLNPVLLMRWFQNNPNGPPEPEQSQSLEALLGEAANWEAAAQAVMEVFYDRLAAEHPAFRGGESRF
jgi:hypothetical protein